MEIVDAVTVMFAFGPLTGALAIAGLSGGLGLIGQERTNRANRNMAQEQMRFQERMSNTAYQRATEDMREAGLNPMLAYMQGGASTSIGSTATMQNSLAAFSSAVQSVPDMLKVQGETDKIAQETTNLAETYNLTKAQTKSVETGIQKILAEVDGTESKTEMQELLNELQTMRNDFYKKSPNTMLWKEIGNQPWTVFNAMIEGATNIIKEMVPGLDDVSGDIPKSIRERNDYRRGNR